MVAEGIMVLSSLWWTSAATSGRETWSGVGNIPFWWAYWGVVHWVWLFVLLRRLVSKDCMVIDELHVHSCTYVHTGTLARCVPWQVQGPWDCRSVVCWRGKETHWPSTQQRKEGTLLVLHVQQCNWHIKSMWPKCSISLTRPWSASSAVNHLLSVLWCVHTRLQIAAFICESAIGPAGEILLPKGYLRAVYKWEL